VGGLDGQAASTLVQEQRRVLLAWPVPAFLEPRLEDLGQLGVDRVLPVADAGQQLEARRTSSAPWGWCSTPSLSGTLGTWAAALDHLRATEGNVAEEDVERLSPLRHDHINLNGRYYFTPSAVARGELRVLGSVGP